MLSWTESLVDDPIAHELLTEYFDSRAAGFPPQQASSRWVQAPTS